MPVNLAAIAVFCNEVKGKHARPQPRPGPVLQVAFVLLHKLRESDGQKKCVVAFSAVKAGLPGRWRLFWRLCKTANQKNTVATADMPAIKMGNGGRP